MNDYSLMDHVPNGICIMDNNWNILFWNRCLEDWTGRTRQTVLGQDLRRLYPSFAQAHYQSRLGLLFEGGPPVILSAQLHKDLFQEPGHQTRGQVYQTTVTALPDGGRYHALFAIENVSEMTRRIQEIRKLQAATQKSLDEKEMLFKELNHRVKNNLAMIVGLITLQSDHIRDPHDLAILNDLSERIRSISLLHERLYKGDSWKWIQLADYLGAILHGLADTFIKKHRSIQLETALEPVEVSVETGLNLGLILTEMVTNTLKYAFADDVPGKIRLEVQTVGGDRFRLVYLDDGRGLPAGFDAAKADSLGMRLITALADGNSVQFKVLSTDQGCSGTRYEFELSVDEFSVN